jgi:hypothetical protein
LRPLFAPVVVALASLLVGCGGDPPPPVLSKLVPTTGTVTLDGKPLAGVLVNFMVSGTGEGGENASAVTDAEGKYSLSTPVAGVDLSQSQGAVPGQYRVAIAQLVMPDGAAVPPGTGDAEAEAMGARQLLPPRYSSPGETTLTAVVENAPTVVDFDLKSGG